MTATSTPGTTIVEERLAAPGGAPCVLLHGALSPDECAAQVEALEALGYGPTGASYPPSYRDNDRLVLDDAGLANELFVRLAAHLPETLERRGATWRLVGLNPRLRGCRYRGGQRFTIHRDGPFTAGPRTRSWLTVMLYLDDASQFEGGTTRFFRERDPSVAPWTVVRPRAGTAIVFDHALWHDGEPVTAGTKHVLRTDVVYQRVDEESAPEPEGLAGHEGYVWQVVALADGRLASAGRDGTVRTWAPDASGRFEADRLLVARPRGRAPDLSGSVLALLEGPGGALWLGTREGGVEVWWPDGAGGFTPAGRLTVGEGALLALARCGERVAAACADGSISLLSAAPGAPARREARALAHAGWVWALAAPSPSGASDELVSAGEDGAVRRWCAATLAPRGEVRGPGPAVRALALEEDGPTWGDAEGRVHRPGRAFAAHAGPVRALLPLPGGGLVTAGEDDRVRVWSRGDACVATHLHGDFPTALARLVDGRVVSAAYDGLVRILG
jgi:WD40 repeat protein